MFAGIGPDEAMLGRAACRPRGRVRTGLISNSMGAGRYDRDSFPELFDGVVISGDVGLHKPQPEIFLLGCERVGLEPAECVFVDDLRENCEGAEAVGMTAVLHRGAEHHRARARAAAGGGARVRLRLCSWASCWPSPCSRPAAPRRPRFLPPGNKVFWGGIGGYEQCNIRDFAGQSGKHPAVYGYFVKMEGGQVRPALARLPLRVRDRAASRA